MPWKKVKKEKNKESETSEYVSEIRRPPAFLV